MSFYVPSFFKKEHEQYRKDNPDYDSLCSEVELKSKNMDPSTVDRSIIPVAKARWDFKLGNIIENMPHGNLRKLLSIYLADSKNDKDYIRGVINNNNEAALIRMCAISSIMGGNDFISEEDVKSKKGWSVQDKEMAEISQKFMDIYNTLSDKEKDNDYIIEHYQTAYCIKKRYDWYPLGNKNILDDMYNFLINDSGPKSKNNDILRLRIDKELAILASFYFWSGDSIKAREICNRIIDGKEYMYRYNPFRIQARCLMCEICISEKDIRGGAKFLDDNIRDYNTMKSESNFKAMSAGNYYENDLFLVFMVKTYDLLEGLSEKSYGAEKSLLVRNRLGLNTDEKIKSLDIHNYRHQWDNHVKNTKDRLSKQRRILKLHEMLSI